MDTLRPTVLAEHTIRCMRLYLPLVPALCVFLYLSTASSDTKSWFVEVGSSAYDFVASQITTRRIIVLVAVLASVKMATRVSGRSFLGYLASSLRLTFVFMHSPLLLNISGSEVVLYYVFRATLFTEGKTKFFDIGWADLGIAAMFFVVAHTLMCLLLGLFFSLVTPLDSLSEVTYPKLMFYGRPAQQTCPADSRSIYLKLLYSIRPTQEIPATQPEANVESSYAEGKV